jgi:5-methylcytosine-specific restriction protein A
VSYKVQQVRKRNRKAVAALKKLYGECQMTGMTYVFLSAKGTPYLEVHHLIPLGSGGADSPHNMVVLSAHAHRMLHHAEVSGLDLAQIKDNSLTFSINGKSATIKWHPKHSELVMSQNSSSQP